LTLLSETISPDLKEGRFITFFLGVLDTELHQVTFANAGHFPVLHYQHATGTFQTLETTGLPLGVWRNGSFPQGPAVSLEPGDILLLATDGAFEQRNAFREMFGVSRLRDTIAEHQDSTAAELIEFTRAALSEFFTAPHPDDDITLLIVKRALVGC